MSGIAIIVEGVDFSSKGLGKVTRIGGTVTVVPLISLGIQGSTLIDKDTSTELFTAVYTPSNTTQTGVTWSSSDTTIATVDANGLVTFNHGSEDKTVTITATSTVNSSIVATKNVVVKATASAAITTKGNVMLAPIGTFDDKNIALAGKFTYAITRNNVSETTSKVKYLHNDRRARFLVTSPVENSQIEFLKSYKDIGPVYNETVFTDEEIEELNCVPLTFTKNDIGKTIKIAISDSNYLLGLAYGPIDLNTLTSTDVNNALLYANEWVTNAEHTIAQSEFGNHDGLIWRASFKRTDEAEITEDDVKNIVKALTFNIE